jgi:penicillin-binding protein-related factor A (putative recombinase)
MDFASYITGFVDGEGCFTVSFNLRSKLKTGIEVRPSFSIGQNKKSLEVLEEIKSYFGVGSIRFSRNDQLYKYEARSNSEIIKNIIPHFDRHPLKTSKSIDFELFKEICLLISENKHQNRDYLRIIIEKAYQMNGSGKRKYMKQDLLRLLLR